MKSLDWDIEKLDFEQYTNYGLDRLSHSLLQFVKLFSRNLSQSLAKYAWSELSVSS